MKPYKKRDRPSKDDIKDILELHRQRYPRKKIKYDKQTNMFYIYNKSGPSALSYETLKSTLNGTGIVIPMVEKERIKPIRKRKKRG